MTPFFQLICWLHVPLLLDDLLFVVLSVAAHGHRYRSDDNNDRVILGAYNSPHGCCLLAASSPLVFPVCIPPNQRLTSRPGPLSKL